MGYGCLDSRSKPRGIGKALLCEVHRDSFDATLHYGRQTTPRQDFSLMLLRDFLNAFAIPQLRVILFWLDPSNFGKFHSHLTLPRHQLQLRQEGTQ